MIRRIRIRTIAFITMVVVLLGLFSLRLYKLVFAEEVQADANSMTYRTVVEAARGNLLDRNGNVLISNRASYNLCSICATSWASTIKATSPSPPRGHTNTRWTR